MVAEHRFGDFLDFQKKLIKKSTVHTEWCGLHRFTRLFGCNHMRFALVDCAEQLPRNRDLTAWVCHFSVWPPLRKLFFIKFTVWDGRTIFSPLHRKCLGACFLSTTVSRYGEPFRRNLSSKSNLRIFLPTPPWYERPWMQFPNRLESISVHHFTQRTCLHAPI